jgi:undecaprenyl-diphosphatase
MSEHITLFQALLLGLVQGLTEFIPISSTAHLYIVPRFLGWADPGAAFSAAIQLGTLAAVFIYFAADIRQLIAAALDGLRHRDFCHTPHSRLAWSIIPGTIPIAVLGLSFKPFIENQARSDVVIASALILLALLLLVSERQSRRSRAMTELSFGQIQLIGLCQALALIPGCSRSGSTIMGGLFVGLKRREAARFSFILGLPAIGASGLLKFIELLRTDLGDGGLLNLALGIAAAGISGYLSIGLLLRFIERFGTYAFIGYRVALGSFILVWSYA